MVILVFIVGYEVYGVIFVVISGIGIVFVDFFLDDGGGIFLFRFIVGNFLLVIFFIFCYFIILEVFGSY